MATISELIEQTDRTISAILLRIEAEMDRMEKGIEFLEDKSIPLEVREGICELVELLDQEIMLLMGKVEELRALRRELVGQLPKKVMD